MRTLAGGVILVSVAVAVGLPWLAAWLWTLPWPWVDATYCAIGACGTAISGSFLASAFAWWMALPRRWIAALAVPATWLVQGAIPGLLALTYGLAADVEVTWKRVVTPTATYHVREECRWDWMDAVESCDAVAWRQGAGWSLALHGAITWIDPHEVDCCRPTFVRTPTGVDYDVKHGSRVERIHFD